MKKVLFTATVDAHINAFHLPYLKYFKEQGYEVHVATNGDEKIKYCDVKHKICFERSPIKLNNIKAIKNLKKIINEEKFDIIHCHTPMGGVVTRIAAMKARKKYGTKVIYTAHGFHFYKGAPLQNWLIFYPIEKCLSKYTDCLITINEEDYELAKRKFKSEKIELVYGVGVDRNKFKIDMTDEEKKSLKVSIGINDDDFVMIIVGECNKNKNQLLAINAMKELVKYNKDIKLILVGIGELEEYYRNIIKENDLDEYIKVLGYRTDIPKLLKISNVLLSLSFREGLPVNVIEAMVSGLPLIATNCRGNRDLVKDGVNGYIINTDDVEGLTDSIIKVYKHNDKLNKDEEFTKKYTLDSIIKDMDEIYSIYLLSVKP